MSDPTLTPDVPDSSGFESISFEPPTPAAPRVSDVEGIILGLAAQEASGCLTISRGDGDEGLVWFRDGQVYAVSVPGRRPLLGVRLVSAGAISADQLNAALELQRSEMHSARLGEVLVHLGLVNRRVIENFALEQQRDMLADLLAWPIASHWFRNGARTRTDLAPFLDVEELIEHARERQRHWPEVVDDLGGADVVPLLTGLEPHAALTSNEATVLRLVNGVRTLTDVADECGFTIFEAADVVQGLAAAGLVTTATALLHDPRPRADSGEEPETPLADVLPLHLVPRVSIEPDLEPEADFEPETHLEPELAAEPEPTAEPETQLEPEPVAPSIHDYPRFEPPRPMSALPPPSGAPTGVPLQVPSFAPADVPPPPVYVPAATIDPTVDFSLGHDSFNQSPESPESGDAPASEHAPPRSEEPNDTASLMRELSSLGLRDL